MSARAALVTLAAAATLLATVVSASTVASATDGHAVRIAYPDEPLAWHAAVSDDPATIDMTALVGLPLYHIDHAGQLRPALAESATVLPGTEGGPWEVEIRIREGQWSDGRAVQAGDVVATLEALDVEGLEAATVVDARTVRLAFDGPYPRWPYLLAGGLSVLPQHVLEEGGIEAFADEAPVTGGPYRLAQHDRGLRVVLERHADSPLGAPTLERLDIWFTPGFETALGLLRDHRVDVVAGYPAPAAVARAGRLDGAQAATPLGGTSAVVRWRADSGIARTLTRLRGARDAIGVLEITEGMLGEDGEPMTSLIPGLDGPWSADRDREASLEGSVDLVLRGRHEIIGFTGRALQRFLTTAGADASTLRLDLDEETALGWDGELTIRRDLPRRELADHATEHLDDDLRAVLLRADRAPRIDDERIGEAMTVLYEHGLERPLFRVAVAHVWRDELAGIRPSAWPGIGIWNAASWRWPEEGPPEQAPTITE